MFVDRLTDYLPPGMDLGLRRQRAGSSPAARASEPFLATSKSVPFRQSVHCSLLLQSVRFFIDVTLFFSTYLKPSQNIRYLNIGLGGLNADGDEFDFIMKQICVGWVVLGNVNVAFV